MYFYPSAYTQGCNIQAHTFAENVEKFTAAGASIIGVSLDSIERLNDFSADPAYCAGKIAVASDVDGRDREVVRPHGAARESELRRTRAARTSATASPSARRSS